MPAKIPVSPVSTQPSRLAITVDDLPYVTFGGAGPADGLDYARRIATTLQARGIVATGFVIGSNITPETTPALRAFAEAGHGFGNHSWSHPDYGTLTPEAFREETRRTDAALAPWLAGPRYYRFPFLREGESVAQRDAGKEVLAELGYRNVPVTIDNDEWRFNADYMAALGKGDAGAAEATASAYLAHMKARTAHFQALAIDKLGGDVDHILLIHLNRINADHLGALLDWYEAEGWGFISVAEALEHPLYARPDRYAGPRGLSHLERVLGGPQN